jgi:hypothetical protein
MEEFCGRRTLLALAMQVPGGKPSPTNHRFVRYCFNASDPASMTCAAMDKAHNALRRTAATLFSLSLFLIQPFSHWLVIIFKELVLMVALNSR